MILVLRREMNAKQEPDTQHTHRESSERELLMMIIMCENMQRSTWQHILPSRQQGRRKWYNDHWLLICCVTCSEINYHLIKEWDGDRCITHLTPSCFCVSFSLVSHLSHHTLVPSPLFTISCLPFQQQHLSSANVSSYCLSVPAVAAQRHGNESRKKSERHKSLLSPTNAAVD